MNKRFVCPIHQRTLTGSNSKSRSGAIHPYYCCTKISKISNCGNRYKVSELDNNVIGVLSSIQFSANVVKSYRKVLKSIFNKEEVIREKAIKELEESIQNNQNRLYNLQNQYLDGKIPSFEEYMNLKNHIDLSLFNDKRNLKNLQN